MAISADPAVPASDLPADGIDPQGRKLAFAGYSGDPDRDLANGFSLAGTVYGDQQPYLERCFANDWPVIAHIGPNITFNDQAPNRYKLDPASLIFRNPRIDILPVNTLAITTPSVRLE